jgi:N-acylneuraminate cytidylyltransferase
MKVLGLITARGGSKGLPGKNLMSLGGRSLLERTCECARQSDVLDRVILSTDSPAIMAAGEELGIEVPFRRPDELAADDSPTIAAIIHALHYFTQHGYVPDAVMVLQPTSPFRRPGYIQEAVQILESQPEVDAVCGVVPIPKEMCPHYVMKITADGLLDNFLPDGAQYTRRQDVPQAYKRDGTLYLTRTQVLLQQRNLYGDRCVPLVVDPAASLTIDTPEDWDEAERRIARGLAT